MALRFDLGKLRKERGLKQSEIAAILNIPQSSVSAMENFKNNVSLSYINTLIEKLSIDNINDYYIEREEGCCIGGENNIQGDGNGYMNTIQKSSSSPDPLLMTKLSMFETALNNLEGRFESRINKLEEKNDELECENKKLHQQVTALMVLCARNGLDFESVLKP